MEIAGVPVRFAVHNAEELRLLESAGGAGGEQRVIELLVNFLRPGDVVYDVGGNVGLFSVVLARAVGRAGTLVVFEPQARNFQHLCANLQLNGLTNARCYRKALGDRSGEALLYASQVIGNSSLLQHGQPGGAAETVESPRATNSFGRRRGPCRGWSRSTLRDLNSRSWRIRNTLAARACELVCCEVHPKLLPPRVAPQSIEALLRELGFGSIDTYPRWDGTFHLAAYKGGRPG